MAICKPILEKSSQGQKRSTTQILTLSDPKVRGQEPKTLSKRAHNPLLKRGWVTKPTGAVPWLGGRLVPLACPDRSAAYAAGAADPLLTENSFYLEWGGDDGSRQQRGREFLTREDPKEQSIRRADWVVGDESFQKRMQGHQVKPCNGGVVGHPSPGGRRLVFRRKVFGTQA